MKKEEAKKLADEALKDLQQELEAGRSEALTRYFDAMSRFHNYSFCNCMLIARQMPEATHVAGFRRWLELGRHVRKGEKGIGILAPLVYRNRDDETNDGDGGGSTIRGFKIVHVFDVSQTDGPDLPELAGIRGEPGELLPALETLVRDSGIELKMEVLPHRLGSAAANTCLNADLLSARGVIRVVRDLQSRNKKRGDRVPTPTDCGPQRTGVDATAPVSDRMHTPSLALSCLGPISPTQVTVGRVGHDGVRQEPPLAAGTASRCFDSRDEFSGMR